MVLKMLKGLGRLMLTTGLLCGVGLFLCSSEVKAAEDATITVVGDNYEISFTPNASTAYTFTDAQILNAAGSKTVLEAKSSYIVVSNIPDTNDSTTPVVVARIPKADLDNALLSKIDGTILSYSDVDGSKMFSLKGGISVNGSSKATTDEVKSKAVYEIVAKKSTSDNTAVGTPSYSITVKDGTTTLATYSGSGTVKGYAYSGNTYEIKSNVASEQYYENVAEAGGSMPAKTDTDWISEGGIWTETIGAVDAAADFYYIPKIASVTGTPIVQYTTNTSSPGVTTNMLFTVNYVNSAENTNTNRQYKNYKWKIGSIEDTANTFETISSTNPDSFTDETGAGNDNKFKNEIKIGNTSKMIKSEDIPGNATAKLMVSYPGTADTELVNIADLSIKAYMIPNGATLNASVVPITVGAGQTKTTASPVFTALLPGAVDPSTTWKVTNAVENGGSILDSVSYTSAGLITVKAKSTATGTTKVKVTVTTTNPAATFDVLVDVKIVSLDIAKTISSITDSKSGRNYITYNKDKNYTLDIKQLIINNAKDTSGNAVTLTKDQIKDVKVDGTTLSDGVWKPTDAKLNAKVNCVIDNSYAITDASNLTVSAYPMPTATYNNSARTVTVKMPGKVSTGLDDASTNIRDVRGFKLILVDSSGNAIGDYTDSKYQKVLSSTTGLTAGDYTISASDIEGMITSAASNGKFSNDTTSVKFKVIPMGYKQSNTSDDDTIRAKDEIYGTTDSTTVYKVSASGTGFDTSSAYGLDGQTVSITASPQAGYTFKQWSDGNTSNPRQVKVSASGTRAFQAVAGERLDPTKNGGDNSSLYDDVPKTAESNSAIWLIVFMVFAVMGTTYALYLQLKAATSKNDK